ncbi:MAG: Cof-type HAD-IIB family hydrolase [Synergistaceae bacterium]|nr:Cof-type HAD-IIB family hydrolase [Synergistaceae bacterium]
MNRKAAFFDIDGTLMTSKGFIPESTRDSIKMLQEKGNLAFICTGRTKVNIPSQVINLGFSGIISGCGTLIEHDNNTLFYYELSHELAVQTLNAIRKYKFGAVYEGRYNLYFDPEGFNPPGQVDTLRKSVGDNLLSINDIDVDSELIISKATCVAGSEADKWDRVKFLNLMSEYYDVLIQQPIFINRERLDVFEIVPEGMSKGSGIRRLCEKLGLSVSDTYAFGDSVNDLEMLNSSGTGIVMGNGSNAAKEYGDYITDDIDHDGIYNALKNFDLI